MAHTKAKKTIKPNYYLVAAVLVILFGISLMYGLCTRGVAPPTKVASVSLGAMQYRFADGKATKRDDATVTSLKSFLDAAAREDLRLGCTTAYYNVVRYTADETQVLLNYGCVYPNAHMYAVRTSGTNWKFISPTNHFDDLGLPVCSYVEQNHISTEIAPVCTTDASVIREAYVAR